MNGRCVYQSWFGPDLNQQGGRQSEFRPVLHAVFATMPAPKASPLCIPRVAIACQGGGSHTAFTAGVLAYLFLAFEHFERRGEGSPKGLQQDQAARA